jgi:hypothetical protein
MKLVDFLKNHVFHKMSDPYDGEREAVFRVAAPRSPVEVYRRFGGACCPRYQGDEYAARKAYSSSR